MRKLPKTLGNNAGSAPTLHRWIEMELEEVFEGYYVNSSLVVRTNSLDAGWHNNVDPRLEHRLQSRSAIPSPIVARKKPRPRVPSVTI
jgi:hypothetical protein